MEAPVRLGEPRPPRRAHTRGWGEKARSGVLCAPGRGAAGHVRFAQPARFHRASVGGHFKPAEHDELVERNSFSVLPVAPGSTFFPLRACFCSLMGAAHSSGRFGEERKFHTRAAFAVAAGRARAPAGTFLLARQGKTAQRQPTTRRYR